MIGASATVPSGQLLVLDEWEKWFTMRIPLLIGNIEIELEPALILSPDFNVRTSDGSVAAVDFSHFYHEAINGVLTSAVPLRFS